MIPRPARARSFRNCGAALKQREKKQTETLKGNEESQTHDTSEEVTPNMRQLTKRELQVIRHIAEGDTSKQTRSSSTSPNRQSGTTQTT